MEMANEFATVCAGPGLFSRLQRALLRCVLAAAPHSLALLDVCCMSTINLRYGYAAGSELLAAYERALKHLTHGKGMVVRCGSDEFAIILPTVDEKPARVLVAGVLHDLARTTLRTRSGQGGYLRASAGGATSRGLAITPRALVQAADSALATAKDRRIGDSLPWVKLAGPQNQL
jgi:diguanylate cyclase (GGDEF)-like protein